MYEGLGLKEVTRVRDDGLRFASKEAGCSTFGYISTTISMSCFCCGKHVSRSSGSFRELIGKKRFVCAGCADKGKKKDSSS